MTERHKDFSSSKRKSTTPVTFTLEGEDFTAVPNVPGAVLLDFVSDADSKDGGRAAQAIINFATNAVIEEDRDRFRNLIRDPEIDIDIETLAQVCEFLVEEYAARPTEPSSASSATRSKSGRGSTARVSVEA